MPLKFPLIVYVTIYFLYNDTSATFQRNKINCSYLYLDYLNLQQSKILIININRLTWIIPRLRHSYYIRGAGLEVSRDSIGYADSSLRHDRSSHMEYRTNLLSVSYNEPILPAQSCRIACDTRIYSTAMRRLRVETRHLLHATLQRGLFGYLRETDQGQGRPFRNGAVIGGRRCNLRPFRRPRVSPSTLLIDCHSSEVTKIRITSFTPSYLKRGTEMNAEAS